ncbi:MAG: cyanophycin synthetase [Eubacteriales bacterium]|nr:cyanophycin synthetase [Eubacteriales bacterium]
MSRCRVAVIGRENKRFDEVYEAASNSPICEKIICYSKYDAMDYALSIPGGFNRENAIAAISVAHELGIPEEAIREGLISTTVPGRMEVFENSARELACVVDYAHNSMGFRELFNSLREMYPGYRLELIYGCPGGKAYSRRSDLVNASAGNVDFVWITEEDPANEDPDEIARVLERGYIEKGTPCRINNDREQVIRDAILNAKPKTVIAVTGKGREYYMHRGDEYVEITSDVDIVKSYI